jgi:hypothetical protein
VLAAPAAGSALTQKPPTFAWNANGGGPTYRNNSFVVQFYDAALTTLPGVTGRQAATRYTPPVAD